MSHTDTHAHMHSDFHFVSNGEANISTEIKGHQVIIALRLTANGKQEKELFLQQSELKT